MAASAPAVATVPAGPAARGPQEDEPIAVIGLSGRYPQARDLDEFWRNLAAGRDCVTEVPADRWDAEALFDADPATPGRSYSRWGGFLSDVDAFDSLFFQISPMQARSMDPQERLFLETAWAALENAGYPPSRIPAPGYGGQGHDVGVFVGVMWDDYAVLAATESARGNHQVVLANRSSIANQVSYFGDFRGPSVVVDTACSASLVALHQACESIRRGECSYAIAGGVNIAVHPDKYVHLSRKTMLSADGRCRAFGAGGSGYVPGEGVGAVVLKRLSEAVRDGDTVHAVIRATAVNHGGRTSGFTVPNPHAQQALVEQALATAGVDARTIGCVEAHGTGTSLGDPIEHTALAQAYAKHTADTGFCALGSVKSVIGHLEGAAGIAGLTKAVLQLRNGTLLPTLHADDPNPAIDFSRSPFTVQRETAPWPQPRDADGSPLPRRAAVSSFGAGGTNAHVILEEYLAPAPAPAAAEEPELIVLSARDDKRLREYAAQMGRALAAPAEPAPLRLADVAHTLRAGREAMAERLAFVAADLADAAAKLTAAGRGEDGQWLHRGRVGQHPPLEGLFTEGPGGQDFLTAQILAGADDLLGRLWVGGVFVDWELVHRLRPGGRRRVPLPTYPFERVRHWLDLRAAAAAEPAAPSVRTWRHTLAAGAPVLRDHVVAGRPILPGVGHLDLVAAACGGLTGRGLADVRWTAPWPWRARRSRCRSDSRARATKSSARTTPSARAAVWWTRRRRPRRWTSRRCGPAWTAAPARTPSTGCWKGRACRTGRSSAGSSRCGPAGTRCSAGSARPPRTPATHCTPESSTPPCTSSRRCWYGAGGRRPGRCCPSRSTASTCSARCRSPAGRTSGRPEPTAATSCCSTTRVRCGCASPV
ncbi:hypothetical protein SAV31267_009830 [Streptomyces avermitilis]|uniref:Ketosynthase family 3 (KS3) domain-containing protein n=1 Tax=Streptomyces avermitilis TaxID=33903 RepID=A0A4D4MHM1_STRAX|nr:hypothetical protein SAV31267_009830 [Streptomyces avermitilis]